MSTRYAAQRNDAILAARAEVAASPAYLDTETTGLDAGDQIIEICVVDHDGAVLLDSLVKPTGRIPGSATAIHGINDAMVKDAPAWPDLWPQVGAILASRRVAIYNAEFDARMLMQTHQRYQMVWPRGVLNHFCIMKLYAQFYGERNHRYGGYRWQRLDQAIEQCRIQGLMEAAHRARPDALAARAVLQHVASSALTGS